MNVLKTFKGLLNKLHAIQKKALETDIRITIDVTKYDPNNQCIFVMINHVNSTDYIYYYFSQWRLAYSPEDESSMEMEFNRLTNKLKEWNLLK